MNLNNNQRVWVLCSSNQYKAIEDLVVENYNNEYEYVELKNTGRAKKFNIFTSPRKALSEIIKRYDITIAEMNDAIDNIKEQRDKAIETFQQVLKHDNDNN